MPIVSKSFLGQTCIGGVSNEPPNFAATLDAVETPFNLLFQGQLALGLITGTFAEFCGMREPHKGQHTGGMHTSGNALDINFESNPYIAIRTPVGAGVSYGGEAVDASMLAAIRMARVRATTVYDRAIAFSSNEKAVANVSARAIEETTFLAYDRFAAASEALRNYLQLVFPSTLPTNNKPPPRLNRVPVPNADKANLATLLAGINGAERLPDAQARERIAAVVSTTFFAAAHPSWSTDIDFWFRQILSDYEVVRIPMVIGSVSLTPGVTRNPANGFLDIRKEFVVALAGDPPLLNFLRWGAVDFGADESGDMQHFDTAGRLPSGVSGASPTEVRINLQTTAGVQQALASLGFDPGPINNNLGALTRTAITAYRAARELAAGEIDVDLLTQLTADLKIAAIPF